MGISRRATRACKTREVSHWENSIYPKPSSGTGTGSDPKSYVYTSVRNEPNEPNEFCGA